MLKYVNTGVVFQEIPDEEIAAVSGGLTLEDYVTPVGWDSKGRVTHLGDSKGNVVHFLCPDCGRILHRGSCEMWYCDPCDEWWFSSIWRAKEGW